MHPDSSDLIALNDPQLAGLFQSDPEAVENEIERLVIEVAQPLVTAVLKRQARSGNAVAVDEFDDIAATINLRLITKLRAVATVADEAIRSFENYIASATFNAINDQLRRLFPERARLKNRLRYAIAHDRRFDLWTADGVLVCGFKAWRGLEVRWTEFVFDAAGAPRAVFDREEPADAVATILSEARRPLPLDALVTTIADLWHVADLRAAEDPGEAVHQELPGSVRHLETRELLRALWGEITQLRPMQRKALLLNLRSADTVNVISLVVMTGTAPFDEVAEAVGMSPEELAELWNSLPLDDLRIAALLDLPRQKVINLRKSARDRLHRRMSRGKL